jgi:hypothetical protein
MSSPLEIEGLNIVVLGALNPQIFQPEWFARQGLIRIGEAEKATIEFINSDISAFSLGWVRVEITRDRASFASNQAQHYELLRDLVASTFKLLRHTPITRFGINWFCHFRMPNIETWHKIGHKLAPKEPWMDIVKQPGMIDVTMQAQRPDDYTGNINITVQPSMSVQPGVYIIVNDDFDLREVKEGQNASDKMIKILNLELVHSLERRGKITDKLLAV